MIFLTHTALPGWPATTYFSDLLCLFLMFSWLSALVLVNLLIDISQAMLNFSLVASSGFQFSFPEFLQCLSSLILSSLLIATFLRVVLSNHLAPKSCWLCLVLHPTSLFLIAPISTLKWKPQERGRTKPHSSRGNASQTLCQNPCLNKR